LERFWESEEESVEDLESEICEENFTKTTHLEQNCKFMIEYMSLGHMVKINAEGKYYLPHQAVI